jgi:hypothetical protein
MDMGFAVDMGEKKEHILVCSGYGYGYGRHIGFFQFSKV